MPWPVRLSSTLRESVVSRALRRRGSEIPRCAAEWDHRQYRARQITHCLNGGQVIVEANVLELLDQLDRSGNISDSGKRKKLRLFFLVRQRSTAVRVAVERVISKTPVLERCAMTAIADAAVIIWIRRIAVVGIGGRFPLTVYAGTFLRLQLGSVYREEGGRAHHGKNESGCRHVS